MSSSHCSVQCPQFEQNHHLPFLYQFDNAAERCALKHLPSFSRQRTTGLLALLRSASLKLSRMSNLLYFLQSCRILMCHGYVNRLPTVYHVIIVKKQALKLAERRRREVVVMNMAEIEIFCCSFLLLLKIILLQV